MSLSKKIHKVAEKYAINGLVLYGSYVDNPDSARDVDICYFKSKQLNFNDYLDCLNELMDIFHKDKVDLVYWTNANSLLKNEIALKNQLLYGSKEMVYNFLHAGQRMYWDDKKYYTLLKEKMKQEANE